MKQISTHLVAIQSVMWRLRPRMNDHPDILREIQDLAWEELHLRYQLRSHQIGLDVNEEAGNVHSDSYMLKFLLREQIPGDLAPSLE